VVQSLPTALAVTMDMAFLAIFGTEFAARLCIARRSQGFCRGEIALLAVDALALLTFVVVPVHLMLGGERGAEDSEFWLIRLVRLVRLVVLVRFLNTTLVELRKILSQRQIRYQLGFLLTSVLLLTFVSAAVLKTIGVRIIDFDTDGGSSRGRGLRSRSSGGCSSRSRTRATWCSRPTATSWCW